MKNFLLVVLAFTQLAQVYAQDRVVIDKDDLDIDAHQAILVRTKNSPSKLSIDMLVPMSESVCERRETRMVMRASSVHCGTVRERRVRTDRVCVERHPNGQCATYRRDQDTVYVDRPRTCLVPESFCVEYGSATRYERDNVRIKFKNSHALAEGEEETFLIRARQKNYDGINVVYDIVPQATKGPYEVKSVGWFNIDSYEIRGK